MRSIAWLSEKGGTGKTTSALNTAAGLGRRGHRVLLIDADPQANSTLVLKGAGESDPSAPTLAHVLVGEATADEAIVGTSWPGVDLLPASIALAEVNDLLVNELGREKKLRRALAPVEADYGFVLVDTSPLRTLLNVNVLNYVREVLVPIDPGLFSLAGLAQIRQLVELVRANLDNDALRIAGLVLTRTVKNNVARDVEAQLRAEFGPLVFASTIPTNAKVEEAHSRMLPVAAYAPRSAGAIAYEALVEELLNDGDRTQVRAGDPGIEPGEGDGADPAAGGHAAA